MNWSEVEDLHAAGWSVEAHTATHPDLRRLSEDAINDELERGDRAIETHLGVRPEMRRHGVGRLLVEEAQSWVRDRGVARIEIQVATGNTEGQAFWRAIGYADLMDVLHKRL